jgi:hypothetical protein
VSENSQVRSAPGGCPEKAAPMALEPDEVPTPRAELGIILLPVDFPPPAAGPPEPRRRRGWHWRRSAKK